MQLPVPEKPRMRPVELIPHEENAEQLYLLRDPQGVSSAALLRPGAALLATLMNGRDSLPDIQSNFQKQTGLQIALQEIESLVRQLDQELYLESDHFQQTWQRQVDIYRSSPVRPAALAGSAYAKEADALRDQLQALFTSEEGPGEVLPATQREANRDFCGALIPHIDLQRGGTTFAHAYKKIVEQTSADLFLIFGTAHQPMHNLLSICRKDFDTPLGIVKTDNDFIDELVLQYNRAAGADHSEMLFEDDLAHRLEHSIEFQTIFLQYLLGEVRPFQIVPILTGSFFEFIAESKSPAESAPIKHFVEALRSTVAAYPGQVFFISGGDLAHIGQQFGDEAKLDPTTLTAQMRKDLQLLGAAGRGHAEAFFQHVAADQDRSRICGLSPTYMLMQAAQPKLGELLKYDQAVDPEGTSCVSFASFAFYRNR